MSGQENVSKISLKTIEQNLKEIRNSLDSPIGTLKYLVKNEPNDIANKQDDSSGSPTLDSLNSVVDSIGKKVGEMSRLANQLVG